MKKILILLVLFSLVNVNHIRAQKFGYIDMEFITGKMPEYKEAQAEMKKFSEKWAKEIDDKFAEIASMERAYMAEEVLLSEDLKRKRQSEIKEKELEAREYNSKIFGMEGLLFQKKKELIKPVMEKVQRAITKICSQKRLDFMFDKSSDVGMVFTNPRHDYSDYIMDELGLNEKSNKESTTAVSTQTNQNQTPANNASKSATVKKK